MESNPMMDDSILEGIIKTALLTKEIPEQINVVRVLNADRKGNVFYIEMEMMPGGTLEVMVDDPAVPLSFKLETAVKIAETISAIHYRGIVHGDLKPENILFSAEKEPFLNDFYLYAPRAGNSMIMPLGTPYYMSPEQAKGALITPSSDIYSAGVLIYELLTGRMPYILEPGNLQEMIVEITEGEIYPPSDANHAIKRDLELVIEKLLEKDAEVRYQKMSDAADDLKACLNNKTISIPYEKGFLEKILSLFRGK